MFHILANTRYHQTFKFLLICVFRVTSCGFNEHLPDYKGSSPFRMSFGHLDFLFMNCYLSLLAICLMGWDAGCLSLAPPDPLTTSLCSMSLGATQMDCSHGFPDPPTSALEHWRALEGETEGGREGGKGGGVGGWVFSSSILSLLSHEGLTVSFDPRSQLLAGSSLQQLFLFLSSRNCYLSLSF